MTNSSIRTYTGRMVDPMNLQAEDVCIEDIAHSLAAQGRFSGHTSEPFFVAQHSVNVSRLCSPPNKLVGLLHDASETYLVDLPRPIKHHPKLAFFRELEDSIQQVIAAAFELPYPFPQEVHDADNIALSTEARDFMGLTEPWPGFPPPETRSYTALRSHEAEHIFLRTFELLMRERATLSSLSAP